MENNREVDLASEALPTRNATQGVDRSKEHFMERTLLKRVTQPVDISRAVVFSASDEASYMNGETIHVDGGSRLLEWFSTSIDGQPVSHGVNGFPFSYLRQIYLS